MAPIVDFPSLTYPGTNKSGNQFTTTNKSLSAVLTEYEPSKSVFPLLSYLQCNLKIKIEIHSRTGYHVSRGHGSPKYSFLTCSYQSITIIPSFLSTLPDYYFEIRPGCPLRFPYVQSMLLEFGFD